MKDVSKLVSRGIEYYTSGDFRESLKYFKETLKWKDYLSNKDTSLIYYNIGLSNLSLYNYEAAKKNFQKSIDIGYESANWEMSITKLHLGDISGMDQWEWRYINKDKFPDLPIPKIKWDKIGDYKNILVLNEQGFGDELLFSRGLSLLKNVNFSYQVYEEMLPLFQDNYDFNFFTERQLSWDFVMEHDCWIPSGDLFKGVLLSKGWDYDNFKSNNSGGNIGVCFKTNILSGNTKLRSCDWVELEKILEKFDNNYISLQKDHHFEKLVENKEISNFLDTSKLIDTCKSIITVDTVVAHLGAIKGKKVILIINDYCDWRWKLPLYKGVDVVKLTDLENYLKNLQN